MISPFKALKLELVSRSEGWHCGREAGFAVGKFNAGWVGGGEEAARLQAAASMARSRIEKVLFILRQSLPLNNDLPGI